jgi:hypothetical protein
MSDRIAITVLLYNETFKVLSTNKNVCVCVCAERDTVLYYTVMKAYIIFCLLEKSTVRQKNGKSPQNLTSICEKM